MPSASPTAEIATPAGRTAHGARYLAGAVLCAVINNIVLIGADAFGLPLAVGVAASWAIGGMTGYLWHARITYGTALSGVSCGQFLAGVAAAIPLTWAVLAGLKHWLGLPMVVAAPVATVILFAYNYLNARLAITRRLSVWRR